MRRATKRALAAALGVLSCAAVARAQTIQGSTRASESAQPIGAAVIEAVDSTGTTRHRSMSAADGSFTVPLPFAGRWTVRAGALGFASTERSIAVGRGEEAHVELRLAPAPLAVAGFDVGVGRRCPERSGHPDVARAWTGARRLFASPFDSAAAPTARFQLRIERSRIYPVEAGYSGEPQVWGVDTVWVEGPAPHARQDAASLVERGFVTPLLEEEALEGVYAYEFVAPGVEVVLSEPFLQTHCFFILERSDTLTGLGFEPDRLSTLAWDVEGTLWLPRTADVLPVLEYWHSRIPRDRELWFYGGPAQRSDWGFELPPPRRKVGGRSEWAFVPEVGWIAFASEQRVPNVARAQHLVAGSGFRDRLRRDRHGWPEGCCDESMRTLWFLRYYDRTTIDVVQVLLDGASGGR